MASAEADAGTSTDELPPPGSLIDEAATANAPAPADASADGAAVNPAGLQLEVSITMLPTALDLFEPGLCAAFYRDPDVISAQATGVVGKTRRFELFEKLAAKVKIVGAIIELKRPGNPPSPEQVAWITALCAAGIDARVLIVPTSQQAFIDEMQRAKDTR